VPADVTQTYAVQCVMAVPIMGYEDWCNFCQRSRKISGNYVRGEGLTCPRRTTDLGNRKLCETYLIPPSLASCFCCLGIRSHFSYGKLLKQDRIPSCDGLDTR